MAFVFCESWPATDNGLKESTAATALGIPLKDFRRLIVKNPDARALWDEALSVERDALLGALFNRAMEGDTKAAQFLLADAGKPDQPGLYISRNCSYFWETVPYLGRDPKRVEDVDSSGPDHAADAVR